MNAPFCQQCGNRTVHQAVEGIDRPVCPVCGAVTYLDPKLAVAVIIEQEGKLLLGRRGPNSREPNRWSFPAGFVERGEPVELAAEREVREETGLLVRLGPLLALLSSPGETVVLAVYTAREFSGTPIASDDLTDLGWFSPAELPDLAFPHDRQIIDAWTALHTAH